MGNIPGSVRYAGNSGDNHTFKIQQRYEISTQMGVISQIIDHGLFRTSQGVKTWQSSSDRSDWGFQVSNESGSLGPVTWMRSFETLMVIRKSQTSFQYFRITRPSVSSRDFTITPVTITGAPPV
jgi:hypothetical protein